MEQLFHRVSLLSISHSPNIDMREMTVQLSHFPYREICTQFKILSTRRQRRIKQVRQIAASIMRTVDVIRCLSGKYPSGADRNSQYSRELSVKKIGFGCRLLRHE